MGTPHLSFRPSSLAAAALVVWTLGALWPSTASASVPPTEREIFEGVLAWPEHQRRVVQDGPGFLMTPEQWGELFDLDIEGRDQWIERFLADPVPETPENELKIGIERRRALARRAVPSFQDVRARLLFLHGRPVDRYLVDCAETFKLMELWRYGGPPGASIGERGLGTLVLYRPNGEEPYKLWLPLDGKEVLYNEEMHYYLQQWEELKHRIRGGRRVDRFFCDDSEIVDRVTGVDGIYGFERDRPKDSDFLPMLRPPEDLAAWAVEAAQTPELNEVPLEGELSVSYPAMDGQRMITRLQIVLDPAQLEVFEEGESKQLRLVVDGVLERAGRYFEDFRVRFQVPYPEEGFETPIALHVERLLRPGHGFLMRLRLEDEISGKILHASRALEIPSFPQPDESSAVPDEAIFAIGQELAKTKIAGHDSLILVPPATDVVFGLWRAEALVTGSRIERIKFYIDDRQVFSRKGPPFTAELRLAEYPKEQIVRAEGYTAGGELIAADEVVLNQPRGELRVRIVEPKRGTRSQGEVDVSAEVVVPEERQVAEVRIQVNDEVIATLERPPWATSVDLSGSLGEMTYITVTARLDDGLEAEDVRFVNAPEYLEEVEVNLIELYTTVTERSGGLVFGLEEGDFEIREDGRPQELAKFELVENLPLSLGIAVDVSGSMVESLGEARRAAVNFLDKIITPRDRVFAVAFSDRPEILMPRTSDVGAVAERLEGLVADGQTSLHDAIVTSLYYYRGIRGRRALVLLSDGADTSSSLEFAEALEYAKRSGVAVYAIGLRIGKADFGVRNKLDKLAQETGGRTFYIQEASDLHGVYGQIEKELRSQYLLAYNSDSDRPQDEYREVEVEVKGGKLKARTISGYYP